MQATVRAESREAAGSWQGVPLSPFRTSPSPPPVLFHLHSPGCTPRPKTLHFDGDPPPITNLHLIVANMREALHVEEEDVPLLPEGEGGHGEARGKRERLIRFGRCEVKARRMQARGCRALAHRIFVHMCAYAPPLWRVEAMVSEEL